MTLDASKKHYRLIFSSNPRGEEVAGPLNGLGDGTVYKYFGVNDCAGFLKEIAAPENVIDAVIIDFGDSTKRIESAFSAVNEWVALRAQRRTQVIIFSDSKRIGQHFDNFANIHIVPENMATPANIYNALKAAKRDVVDVSTAHLTMVGAWIPTPNLTKPGPKSGTKPATTKLISPQAAPVKETEAVKPPVKQSPGQFKVVEKIRWDLMPRDGGGQGKGG